MYKGPMSRTMGWELFLGAMVRWVRGMQQGEKWGQLQLNNNEKIDSRLMVANC